MNEQTEFSRVQRIAGWLVHLYTALSGIIALYCLYAIYYGEYITAFWLMGAALVIDASDGTLARRVKVNMSVPMINGALLDNIMDYLNYVMVPAFFFMISDVLPAGWSAALPSAIMLASAYQFTQTEAKTADHFFKGFPSYWNFVAFYMYISGFTQTTNALILAFIILLVFIPIKYIYPSRMDNVTHQAWIRHLILGLTLLYGVVTVTLLWLYPERPRLLIHYTQAFVTFYVLTSLYRTLFPLKPKN